MAFIELTEDTSWVPDSCTLPTAAQPVRMSEFDELLRTAVTGQERTGATSLRLMLKADPAVAATTAELAAREANCCGFFAFTLTITGLDLHLTVEVPPAQVDVLEALAQRAAAARR